MSRRTVLIALFALLLVTPMALRLAIGRGAISSQAARGKLRLVIITPNSQAINSEFADAFSAWHEQHFGQPVFIDYRSYGGASDIVRYFDSARATLYKSLGTFQVDLVWGGGDELFDRRLREPGYLEGVRLPDDVMK